MTETAAMSPEIKAFFDESLPKATSGHVLVLGENHTHYEHVLYLQKHLQTLVSDHHLGTFGCEMPPFDTIFFSAYQDGLLDRLCGSHEAARNYFLRLVTATINPDRGIANVFHAEILADALDAGIRVVGFDSRFLMKDTADIFLKVRHYLDNWISDKALETGSDTHAVMQSIRSGEITLPRKLYAVWEISELHHLCEVEPSYATRLKNMESIIEIGRKKQIGSDALSAAVFEAAKDPHANAIALIGFHHISTKVSMKDNKNTSEARRVHGTFADHIRWLETEHLKSATVRMAVMGSTGNVAQLEKLNLDKSGFIVANTEDDVFTPLREQYHYLEHRYYAKKYDMTPETKEEVLASRRIYTVLAPSQRSVGIARVDLTEGKVSDLAQPNKEDTVPIAYRFMKPWAWDDSKLVKQRMNPLLVPEIKKAFDTVRAYNNAAAGMEQNRGR